MTTWVCRRTLRILSTRILPTIPKEPHGSIAGLGGYLETVQDPERAGANGQDEGAHLEERG